MERLYWTALHDVLEIFIKLAEISDSKEDFIKNAKIAKERIKALLER